LSNLQNVIKRLGYQSLQNLFKINFFPDDAILNTIFIRSLQDYYDSKLTFYQDYSTINSVYNFLIHNYLTVNSIYGIIMTISIEETVMLRARWLARFREETRWNTIAFINNLITNYKHNSNKSKKINTYIRAKYKMNTCNKFIQIQ